jgi:hypothetical protein
MSESKENQQIYDSNAVLDLSFATRIHVNHCNECQIHRTGAEAPSPTF